MNLNTFEKIIKNLNRDKFHICITFNECEFDKIDWVIYRKDMSLEEYFSPENKPILDSKNNTECDLIKFIQTAKM